MSDQGKTTGGPRLRPVPPSSKAKAAAEPPPHDYALNRPVQLPRPAEDSRDGEAALLLALMTTLAERRHACTVTYARAYLAAEGTAEARTQAARLASADAHLAAERVAALLACHRYMTRADE